MNLNIWKYPQFSLLLGYVWLEQVNPLIGYNLQLINKVPNGAIALLLAYLVIPAPIKRVVVPFKPVYWTLPFLIIATINLPFVERNQLDTIVELTSTWFWVIFLFPLSVRVLATPSGRWHFAFFTTISITILSIYFLVALNRFSFGVGSININRHHLAAGVILILPIIVGYIFQKKGLSKLFLIGCLGIIVLGTIPSGARSAWIILPIQFFLLFYRVLPKRNVPSLILVLFFGLPLFLVFSQSITSRIYSDVAIEHFSDRIGEARNWKEDQTLFVRAAMYKKTWLLLSERPLLGVGYSNRNFAYYKTVNEVNILGVDTKIKGRDAHNTYLNIIGGMGILGFLAFFFFARKVYKKYLSIDHSLLQRLDVGPFLVSVLGILAWYMINTHSFAHIVFISSLVLGVFCYQVAIIMNLELQKNN